MQTLRTSLNIWNNAFNDVTRLCLFAATGCFFAGGLLLLADIILPLGPRGIALMAVGCFFLAHGLIELIKLRWKTAVPTNHGLSTSPPRTRAA